MSSRKTWRYCGKSIFSRYFPLKPLRFSLIFVPERISKQDEHIFSQDEDDGQAFYIVDGRALGWSAKTTERQLAVRDLARPGSFMGGLACWVTPTPVISLKSVADTTCLL